MASRTASRALLRSSFKPAHTARFALPAQGIRVSRGFASEAPKSPPKSSQSSQSPPKPPPQSPPQDAQGKSKGLLWAAALAIVGAGGYFYLKGGSGVTSKDYTPSQKDYQKVYDEIAHKLSDETDYEDGSYGPVSIHPYIHEYMVKITNLDRSSCD